MATLQIDAGKPARHKRGRKRWLTISRYQSSLSRLDQAVFGRHTDG